jgi:hypothetical protein
MPCASGVEGNLSLPFSQWTRKQIFQVRFANSLLFQELTAKVRTPGGVMTVVTEGEWPEARV